MSTPKIETKHFLYYVPKPVCVQVNFVPGQRVARAELAKVKKQIVAQIEKNIASQQIIP